MCSHAVSRGNSVTFQSILNATVDGAGVHAGTSPTPKLSALTPNPRPAARLTMGGRVLS
jgi:hypothetical protein